MHYNWKIYFFRERVDIRKHRYGKKNWPSLQIFILQNKPIVEQCRDHFPKKYEKHSKTWKYEFLKRKMSIKNFKAIMENLSSVFPHHVTISCKLYWKFTSGEKSSSEVNFRKRQTESCSSITKDASTVNLHQKRIEK